MRVDAFGDAAEFGAIDDAVVDQAGEQLFKRASAESFEDGTDSVGRGAAGLAGARVEELAAIERVAHILLGFEAAEDGADGGIGQRAAIANGGADGFSGGGAVGPEVFHDLPFEIAEAFLTRHKVPLPNVTLPIVTETGRKSRGFLQGQ
jgi:hypothetical protein